MENITLRFDKEKMLIVAELGPWIGFGNDITQAILELLESIKTFPADMGSIVACNSCGELVFKESAEQYHGRWIGTSCGCWDERLRITS